MKKTTIKSVIILFSILAFTACSSDDSGDVMVEFAGTWSGTFSGGDSGTWQISVTNNGTANGEVFSNNLGGFLSVSGSVDTSGDFRATAGSAENGATFSGTFVENSSSGTWENNAADISGTWQGSRD